jgi:hypothetical protein
MNWVFHRYKEPTLFASTLPKPHEPTLNPKLCQRACKSSPSTAFQDGLGFAHAQKKQNKFVLRGKVGAD